MTATVRVYKSTDTSAPSLSGTAGSLVALLDACLVNGYGSTAAAGWTKPYTATNKAVFYMGTGTPRMYIDVDDSGAQEARAVGYETMSAVATGTGPFPTAAQLSGGLFVRKSNTADSTARPWMLIACERAFHLFIGAAQTTFGQTGSSDGHLSFGVFPSYKSGDAYNCHIKGQVVTGAAATRGGTFAWVPQGRAILASAGLYVARAFTQIGGSINPANMVPGVTTGANTANSTMGSNLGSVYPDPITGGMRLARVLICEDDGSGFITERGYMPGLWCPMHNLPGSFFDTFSGSGTLSGKTFILPPSYNTSTTARTAVETNGSWDN